MRKALIIGIDKYPNDPLDGCANDAKSLAQLLEKNWDGSPNFSVNLKIEIQTKEGLEELIEELFTGNSDVSLLYFSGHGYLDGFGGHICTPDFKKYSMGVSMENILRYAEKNTECKNKVIIFDCCHSSAIGECQSSPQKSIISDGLTILTACRSNESAIEINGHGVFTSLLLNALKGEAANLKGEITPGSVYSYIDQALGPWDQRPVFKTNITRFISLRRSKPQIEESIVRKIVDYFPSPTAEFNLNPSFEFTNSNSIEHKVIEPHANEENVKIFKNLQKLESVGLIVPVGEEHMYFAAMNSKSCKLTDLGNYYWQLVKYQQF